MEVQMPETNEPPMSQGGHLLSNQYDLDPYRELLEELYIKQGLSLKKVIDIIRARGCLATRSMFLRKINAWGLVKNKKHDEMVQMLIQIRQYRGKSSKKLNIRGRMVKEDEVLTYFRRRQAIVQKNACKQAEQTQVDGNIPWTRHQKQHQLKTQMTIQEPFYTNRADLYDIYNVQTWILSPIKTGSLQTIDEATRQQHTQLYEDIVQGTSLLELQAQTGGSLLERAFRQIAPLVKEAKSDLLRSLNMALLILQHNKWISVAEALAKYCYQASLTIHGRNHPMTRAFDVYFKNHSDVKMSSLVAQIRYDAAADLLGRSNEMVLGMLYNLITALRVSGASFEELISKYEALIQDSSHLPPPFRSTRYQRDYGIFLTWNGRYVEGMSYIKQAASPFFNGNWSDTKDLEASMHACMVLADYYMGPPEQDKCQEDSDDFRRKYSVSRSLYKSVIKKAEDLMGQTSYMAIGARHRLVKFYQRCGDPMDESEETGEIQQLLAEFSLSS